MAPRRREPRWLTRRVIDVIHDGQLREHGGRTGVRDDGMIESALARPRHKWTYAKSPDLPALAAAYAFGLARNHGYVDGNKRTAFMALYVFLGMNGHEVEAEEPDVVATMEGVASGRITESQLGHWIRSRLRRDS